MTDPSIAGVVRDCLLAILILVACYTDFREQKIKNALTGPVMLAGLLLSPWSLAHAYDGILGFFAVFLVAVPFWRILPAISAGDVKMLLAAGTLLGPRDGARAVLLTLLVGLPAGLLVLLLRGRLLRLAAFYKARGKGMEATRVLHAPVVGAGILLARYQGWPAFPF